MKLYLALFIIKVIDLLVLLIREEFVSVIHRTVESLRERLGEGTEGVFGGSFDTPRFLRPVDKRDKTPHHLKEMYSKSFLKERTGVTF